MNYTEIVELVYKSKQMVFSKSKRSQVKTKNPYDFVTAVDTEISDFLKKELNERYPDVGCVTEEEQEHAYSNKFFILDPIDGTTNLVYDYRLSSISLAYVENGQVVFGVVFNPFAKEMFFSIKGNGAYCISTSNGIGKLLKVGVENYKNDPLKCSQRDLRNSIIEFGASSSRKDMTEETFSRAARIFEKCLDLRRICSSALAICYIAAARIDGYFEKILKPWDYAAAILILAESGGISSDWQGEALTFVKSGTIICSNWTIYNDLKKLL